MLSRRSFLAAAVAAPRVLAQSADDWAPLFDGRSLEGWKAGGPAESFQVVEGAISASGPRAHLFYAGPVRNATFRNFELKLEVLARPRANSGVFFHTAFQTSGWPEQGFEIQINNSALGEGRYRERKKTGSLYGVRNVYKAFARDDEWFPMHIAVRGNNVQVSVNGVRTVDYTEANPPIQAPVARGRVLGKGTFALQCHDPGSKALFRNILVRPLPDDLPGQPAPATDDIDRELLRLGANNYPLVDYHVHVRGGWTFDEAIRQSQRTGIQYGIAVNCGKNFPVTTDAGARDFIASLQGKPVFIGMQAEGREWVGMFSRETVAAFDYIFTDSMTFSDDNGKRMRTWIKEEVGEIADKQKFMDLIVRRAVEILTKEPVDIYANPTFVPDAMAADYDQLWTRERMERVIEAAQKTDVAIELNNRYKLPGAAFIKLAKSAGLKFSFGTNNTDRNVGRCEYGLEMVRECGLGWEDFFVPKPAGEKPVERRGLPA